MATTKTAKKPRKRASRTVGFNAAMKKAKTANAAAAKKGKGDPLYQMGMFTAPTSADTLPMEPGVQDVQRISLASIFKPDGFNSRRQLWGTPEKGEDLDSMVASLKEHGLLEPIVVCVKDFGSIEAPDVRHALIVGERRYAALKTMKVDHVSAVVMTCSLKKALRLNKVENTHRKALAPWEIAIACHEARERGGRGWRPLTATDLSMSPEAVSNYCGAYDLIRPHAEAWDSFQRGTLGVKQIIQLRSVTKKRAKKDEIEIGDAFVRVWADYVKEAEADANDNPPNPGGNGTPPANVDKPSRKELREMVARLGLALGPAGKLAKGKHRDWAEGAYFVLLRMRGEVLATEMPNATFKALEAARQRAEKEAARIDAAAKKAAEKKAAPALAETL